MGCDVLTILSREDGAPANVGRWIGSRQMESMIIANQNRVYRSVGVMFAVVANTFQC